MPVTVDFIHSQETQVYLVIKAVCKGLGVAATAITWRSELWFSSERTLSFPPCVLFLHLKHIFFSLRGMENQFRTNWLDSEWSRPKYEPCFVVFFLHHFKKLTLHFWFSVSLSITVPIAWVCFFLLSIQFQIICEVQGENFPLWFFGLAHFHSV